MRSSFTPEEVTRIEDKAYEVGIRIGKLEERKRILNILSSQVCDCTTYCERLDVFMPQLLALIHKEDK